MKGMPHWMQSDACVWCLRLLICACLSLDRSDALVPDSMSDTTKRVFWISPFDRVDDLHCFSERLTDDCQPNLMVHHGRLLHDQTIGTRRDGTVTRGHFIDSPLRYPRGTGRPNVNLGCKLSTSRRRSLDRPPRPCPIELGPKKMSIPACRQATLASW